MTTSPVENLTREDWIKAARKALIRGGIAAIKVDSLARQLHVTRGSFYWHFKDRSDLMRSLLLDWKHSNTDPFRRVTQDNIGRPADQLAEFFCIWLRANEFDPDYDSAVRDWARVSASVTRLVKQVDDARIDVLKTLFNELKYSPIEAEIRARVMYYHQVGYYALRVRETIEYRRSLFPTYYKVLVGRPFPERYLDEDGSLSLASIRSERRAAT